MIHYDTMNDEPFDIGVRYWKKCDRVDFIPSIPWTASFNNNYLMLSSFIASAGLPASPGRGQTKGKPNYARIRWMADVR
jgi:hypothetical protein